MATWKMIGDTTFNQDIDATSTTQKAPLGATVKARDIDQTGYGDADFIYGVGVASTAAGDLVTLDGSGFTTVRADGGDTGKVAVAMSANVANQYGWYCVNGTVAITSGTVADGEVLYLTSTAGSVDDAVVAGDKIYGAFSVAASSGGTTLSSISYPFVTDASN